MLTAPDLPSGSDRICAALNAVDRGFEHDVVVNLQGDLPTIDPVLSRACVDAMATTGADIATLVAEIDDDTDADNPNVTKAVVTWDVTSARGKRALFHPGARAVGRGAALFPHRDLRLHARGAGAVRRPAAFAAGKARKAGAVARPRSGHDASAWRGWTRCRSASIRRTILKKARAAVRARRRL